MPRSLLKVLFLPKYAQLGASARHRAYQYLPALKASGIRCSIQPLLSDRYLEELYASGRKSKRLLLLAFARRIATVLGAIITRPDVVIIHIELLPYCPPLLELLLWLFRVRFIVDNDDALFHQYDDHPNRLVRFLVGGKIATVMRRSNLVIAGNQYIAEYARGAGARAVEVIPTVIDIDRYRVEGAEPAERPTFVVGWIGSPSTAKYVIGIASALRSAAQQHRLKLVMIGSGAIEMPGIDVEVHPWSEATEVAWINSFDVGIMPLPDNPWERGKCGFKLIQYMACAKPVIASPVGVNAELVEPGVNGLLASTPAEWQRAIDHLIDQPQTRAAMGRNGRALVEQRLCMQQTSGLLKECIVRVAA
jgi:glycosyltransferase involved in cell wall biosynthesis